MVVGVVFLFLVNLGGLVLIRLGRFLLCVVILIMVGRVFFDLVFWVKFVGLVSVVRIMDV